MKWHSFFAFVLIGFLLILAVIPAKKPTLIATGLNLRVARY
jgi:hypothetical protein